MTQVIHRTVNLETFRSRFPGLIPYFNENGDIIEPQQSQEGEIQNNWGGFPVNIEYYGEIYSYRDLILKYTQENSKDDREKDYGFIEFFNHLQGKIMIPNDIIGYEVPEYILYSEMDLYEEKLLFYRDINRDKYNDLGGFQMESFLKNKKGYLKEEINNTVSSVSFDIPNISIPISLTRDVYETGLFTQSDECCKNNSELEPISLKIKTKGESRLNELKLKCEYDEESGEEVKGLFKKFGKYGRYDKTKKVWDFTITNDTNNFIVLPTFYPLFDKKYEKGTVFIRFDNGVYYNIINNIDEDYALYDNKSTSVFVGGKKLNIKEYTNNTIPLSNSSNIIYHLKNFVYNDEKVVFNAGDYIKYSTLLKKYEKYTLPSTIVKSITENNYLKIKNDDGEYLYGNVYDCDYVKIGTSFYKIDKVATELPYKVSDEKIGDFIDNITYQNNEVLISYVFDRTNDEFLEKGIVYEESYYSKINDAIITIDGNEIPYFYLELTPKVVKEAELQGLRRKYIESDISYFASELWREGDDTPTYYSFKEEYMDGITNINHPNINVSFNRGNTASFERYFKLMECNTFEDLKNYGNDYFNIRKETPLK